MPASEHPQFPAQVVLAGHIEALLAKRAWPVTVAIDGRSGAGKSTVAKMLAAELAPRSVVVIEGDDFYAGGDGAFWDARTAAEKVAHGIDWARQRPVLTELRAGRATRWFPFDWNAFDGSLATTPIAAEPADVIVLEGAYSARPELADLLDLRVLLEIPEARRWRQLIGREGSDYVEEWDARWRSAEDHYFTNVAPRVWFDLVLTPPQH